MLIFAGKSFRDMRKTLRVFTPIYILLALAGMFAACDDTYNEKQMATRKQRAELRRLDSLAFKIGTTPTMDCLPVFIANEKGFFEKEGVDVRLRLRNSHLDLDTLLRGGWIEGAFTELVRAERIVDNGVKLRYVAATNSYWQLVSNRNMRIRKLDQLSDKMVAMTRFSATDYLTTLAVDSAKPKNAVYRIQINDVKIRLRMLYNNEIDAVWLTEPLFPPFSTGDDAGSTAIILMFGFFSFSLFPIPDIVPPVPTPATKMSTCPSVSSHISTPVVS